MTEQELDRQLGAAINVDHAPEFPARVRLAIAAQPGRRWPWRLTIGAAAVAVVTAAVVSVIVTPPASEGRGGSARSAIDVRAAVPPATASRPVVNQARTEPDASPRSRERARTTGAALTSVSRAPRPDVEALPQIASSERRAFQLLLRSARDGRLAEALGEHESSDGASTGDDEDAPETSDASTIEIPPVAVQPLEPAAALE